jgi:DNA-directed RNA polymerase specialized sigma24 family protein
MKSKKNTRMAMIFERVRKMAQHHAYVDDLVQAVMFKLLQANESVIPDVPSEAWIMRVVQNAAIDVYRARKLELRFIDRTKEVSTTAVVRAFIAFW